MSQDASNPTAFLSYARFNDQHDVDALSNLSAKLEGEIRTVTGDSFKIFQDRRDIQVGQNWLERINQALDSVTLLIAILTPSFFRSDCLAFETCSQSLRSQHEMRRRTFRSSGLPSAVAELKRRAS